MKRTLKNHMNFHHYEICDKNGGWLSKVCPTGSLFWSPVRCCIPLSSFPSQDNCIVEEGDVASTASHQHENTSTNGQEPHSNEQTSALTTEQDRISKEKSPSANKQKGGHFGGGSLSSETELNDVVNVNKPSVKNQREIPKRNASSAKQKKLEKLIPKKTNLGLKLRAGRNKGHESNPFTTPTDNNILSAKSDAEETMDLVYDESGRKSDEREKSESAEESGVSKEKSSAYDTKLGMESDSIATPANYDNLGNKNTAEETVDIVPDESVGGSDEISRSELIDGGKIGILGGESQIKTNNLLSEEGEYYENAFLKELQRLETLRTQ